MPKSGRLGRLRRPRIDGQSEKEPKTDAEDRRKSKDVWSGAEIRRIYCIRCGFVVDHLYRIDRDAQHEIYKCMRCNTEKIYKGGEKQERQGYDGLGFDIYGLGGI